MFLEGVVVDQEGECVVRTGKRNPLHPTPDLQRYAPYLYFTSGNLVTYLIYSQTSAMMKLHFKSPCCGRGMLRVSGAYHCQKCRTEFAVARPVRPFAMIDDGAIESAALPMITSWFEAMGENAFHAALHAHDLYSALQRQVNVLCPVYEDAQ